RSFQPFWIQPPIRPEDSLFGAFIHRLAVVLYFAGNRLARCASSACQCVFVKVKSNQTFCSKKCLSREGMRKFRAHQRKAQRQSSKGRVIGTHKKGGRNAR